MIYVAVLTLFFGYNKRGMLESIVDGDVIIRFSLFFFYK